LKTNKWLMFAVVYICSATVAVSQLKIPPIVPLIAASLNITVSRVGWLMALFTIAGIVLAIPGGSIMSKLGPKRLLIFLMGCVTIGNFLGAKANNFNLLLVSRSIEGIAFSMIMTVSIYIIQAIFSDGGAGLAVGIYNTFFPASSFLTLNTCRPIAAALGYSSLWVITGLLGCVCLILVGLMPAVPGTASETATGAMGFKLVAKNGRIWLLAASMGVVAFMMLVCLSTYPFWFENLYRLDADTANFYASLNGLAGIPCSIFAGMLVDKTKKPYLLYILGLAGLVITALTFDLLGPKTYPIHPLFSSLCGSVSMTTIFYLAPQLAVKPEYAGYCIAFVNQVYFMGDFASAPVILRVIEQWGFTAAKYLMTVITIIGVVLAVSQLVLAKISPAQSMDQPC